jgi:hypothetical protein
MSTGVFKFACEKSKKADRHKSKRNRTTKQLNWQKIERYHEEQRLKQNIEDIFSAMPDIETLF